MVLQYGKKRVLMLLAAVVLAGGGCASVTVGPEYSEIPDLSGKPLLRLDGINETLTGTWAANPQAVGFKSPLMNALREPKSSKLFSTDPANLSMQIDLVSDHADDTQRLSSLGMTSLATIGIIPLSYFSEWNVGCKVSVRMTDGTLVAEYSLQETGTYKTMAYPLTMFSLFGDAMRGNADGVEMQKRTTQNLAAKIAAAVAADYERLAQFKESNAQLLARKMAPLSQPPMQEPVPVSSVQDISAPRAGAQTSYAPFYGRRVAVVIGINQYEKWPPLEGAVGDAQRISAMLRDMGFNEVIEVYDRDATRQHLLRLLGMELAQKVTEEDFAFIFFAGHGQTETLPNGQKRGYIIPVDGDAQDVFSTAISMDTLRDLSNRLPAKHVYYAMDSCYSGLGFVRGLTSIPKTQGYLEKITSKRAVQMITAGMEGETAAEFGGQGLFTTKLLEAFRGEADFDGDGFVTANEIGTYVRPSVTNASADLQTPQFGSLEGSGEVVFEVKKS